MEETDSDSDGSHISATPTKKPIRPPLSPPPPIPSPFKSRVIAPFTSTPISKPKPSSKRKSSKPKSKTKPSTEEPTLDLPFPSADLSNLRALSVKIQRPFDQNQTAPFSSAASFSRFVKARRPLFDPEAFGKEETAVNNSTGAGGDYSGDGRPVAKENSGEVRPVAKKHSGEVPPEAPRQSHHATVNWLASGSFAAADQVKTLKRSNEGNFVRLNINGHGRKYAFRNGKRRCSSSSSRGPKYRRKWKKVKLEDSNATNESGAGVLEEDGLVVDILQKQRESSNLGSESLEKAVIAAREEPSDENLEILLKETHGYHSFREGQLEVIKRVIAKESTMVVLPTGAGKSLCYQLPALILPGITLVVSPLVALMVDQLKKLPPMISGALLCSSQTSGEAAETLSQLCEGKIKVLFVSPERFSNSEFLSVFMNAPPVSLVVVDEAHCISEWSHNFRPSYLRLRALLFQTKLKAECVLAMTATATTQTLQDVMRALEIQPSNLIQKCQMRENLQLSVTLSTNRLKDLLKLMKSSPLDGVQSVIVYCKFQSETDLISKYLCDNNIPAKSYHGSIPAKDRSRIQELFCSNKIRVVVATVAFGMGVDKSDVGAVIHYSLPKSLEEYVQETGRAGRDGRISYCHLLFDDSTYYKLRSLLYSDGTDEYAVNRFLDQIFYDDVNSTGNICSLVKESASQKFDMKEEVLLTVLTQLELGEVQYLFLQPQLNVSCTLYFHKTSPTLLSNKDMLVAAILKKSENKQGHYVFDIPTVANNIKITTSMLLNQLQNLKSLGEITYDVKDPAFCYTIVKKPEDICSLASHLTRWLAEVESCKVRKLDAMFNVANFAAKECKRTSGCSESLHTSCMQSKILEYFCKDQDIPRSNFSNKMERSRLKQLSILFVVILSERSQPLSLMIANPFLRADIKVFLQSNSHTKFTPRAVARIMHGISSPAFPSATWSKGHFWGRYSKIEFPVVMEAATIELMNLVGKGHA